MARWCGNDTTTAKALVFIPNPVQSSGDETITDQKDSATAVPRGEYYEVSLTDLDGSGYLRGTWANVRSSTGTPAYSTDGTYFYNRHDDQFEQVMSYFWGTEAQKYLQSLGFSSELPPVNAESQDYKVDQYGVDNSFSWDKHDTITLGKGGVDDAEDGEVIVHEMGHAVHDHLAVLRVLARGRLDWRGMGRLLLGDRRRLGSEEVRRSAESAAGMCDGLGFDVVHVDDAALPAPSGRRQALSGGRCRRSACGR